MKIKCDALPVVHYTAYESGSNIVVKIKPFNQGDIIIVIYNSTVEFSFLIGHEVLIHFLKL